MPLSAFVAVALAALVGCSSAPGSNAGANAASDGATAAPSGTVDFYTDFSSSAVGPIIAAFNKQYPKVHVNVLDMSTQDLVPRIETEQRAGEYNMDVVMATTDYVWQLVLNGGTQKYHSADAPPLSPSVKVPAQYKGYYTIATAEGFGFAYNPKELKQHGIAPPTSLEDFTKPAWKGEFSVNAADVDWYNALIGAMGKAKALALINALGKNDPVNVTSHSQAATQVQSGAQFGTVDIHAEDGISLKKATPSTFDYVIPNPYPVTTDLVAIGKNAPHLTNAKILFDWIESQKGQQAIVDVKQEVSLRSDVTNNPGDWNTSKWPPAFAPLISTSTFNAELAQLDNAFHVPTS
jgi:iron(III) transport system substrate-binding protein